MLLVKNTVKNHWPIFYSTVCCCFQSVEKKYKIMVLHLGTASPPWLDKPAANREMRFAEQTLTPGRAGSTSVQLQLSWGGSSYQLSQSRIIRKGNPYAKFNNLILTLTTGCRKIDRPFAMSALAGSSCFRSGAALRLKLPGMVRSDSLPLSGRNSMAPGY